MEESVQVVLVALGALLVGAIVPVLIALTGTLKQTRRTMQNVEKHAMPAIDHANAVLNNVDQVMGDLRRGSNSVANISQILEDLTTSLTRVHRSVKIAAAVGASVAPAIVAGVRALRGQHDEPTEEEMLAAVEPPGNGHLPLTTKSGPPLPGGMTGQEDIP